MIEPVAGGMEIERRTRRGSYGPPGRPFGQWNTAQLGGLTRRFESGITGQRRSMSLEMTLTAVAMALSGPAGWTVPFRPAVEALLTRRLGIRLAGPLASFRRYGRELNGAK